MVDNQIESDVDQMDFFNKIVKLLAGEHFEGVPVYVKHAVSFDLSVARLNHTFFTKSRDLLYGLCSVQPIYFLCPLFLDDFNHVTLVLWFVLCIGERYSRLS